MTFGIRKDRMSFLEDQVKRIERRGRRRRYLPFLVGIVLLLVVAVALSGFIFYSMERSITVIDLQGEMYTGDYSDGGVSGSEAVGRQLRNAADDSLVDAIVLRVNSPGGSPAAAQEIVEDLKYARARKPVVVSMGDPATSAAYYVCAYADRIYANPDSLTGGIGTLWIFYDISEWLNREGYAVQVIKSGEKKDMTYPYRPLTEGEEAYAQELVNRSFERFVADIVAERGISREIIEDGRVIRGEEARTLGLVDELGNLHDAMEGARILAHAR